jgi:hypothetical protein
MVRSSTTTFNAGDQITVQVTQPGVGTPTVVIGPPPLPGSEMNQLQRRLDRPGH